MIEKIIWYLLVLDCLTYVGLTISAHWNSKRKHHFWKGIPLHWSMALLYVGLLAWLGYALFRMKVLF